MKSHIISILSALNVWYFMIRLQQCELWPKEWDLWAKNHHLINIYLYCPLPRCEEMLNTQPQNREIQEQLGRKWEACTCGREELATTPLCKCFQITYGRPIWLIWEEKVMSTYRLGNLGEAKVQNIVLVYTWTWKPIDLNETILNRKDSMQKNNTQIRTIS